MAFNIDNKFIRKIRVNDASANIENRNITKLYISGNPEGEYSWAEAYSITPLPDTVTGIDLSTVKVSAFYTNESDAKMVNINLYNFETLFYGFGAVSPGTSYGDGVKGYTRQIIAANTLLHTNSDDMNSYVYNSEKFLIEAKPVKGYTSVNWAHSNMMYNVPCITQISPASHGYITNGVTSDINLSDYILEPDGLITLEKPRVISADTILSGTGNQYDSDFGGELGDATLSAVIANDNNLDVVVYYAIRDTTTGINLNSNNLYTANISRNSSTTITFVAPNGNYKYLYLFFTYGAAQSDVRAHTLATRDVDVSIIPDSVAFVTQGESGTYEQIIECNSSYYIPASRKDPLYTNNGIFTTFHASIDDDDVGKLTFSPNNKNDHWEGKVKIDNSIISAVNQDSSKVYNFTVYVQLKWYRMHMEGSVAIYDEERNLTNPYAIPVEVRYSIPVDWYEDPTDLFPDTPGHGIPGGPELPGTGGGKWFTTVVGSNGSIISQLSSGTQIQTHIGNIGGVSGSTNINTNIGGVNLG